MSPFRIEALSSSHDRSSFACEGEALDRYFQTQVTQDIRRRVTNCFVAVHAATASVAGYYTLAASSIATPELPADVVKKLPRYASMPAARIGRLAVDRRYRGLGLGSALLVDAADRTLQSAPAAFALVVDAKHSQAADFYRHHGFQPFPNRPLVLFQPLAKLTRP